VTKHLARIAVLRAAPEAAQGLVVGGPPGAAISWLESPDSAPMRHDILVDSLTATLNDIRGRLGPDMGAWTWGRLHHAYFAPPAAVLADRELGMQMTVGPLEVPGGASSPRAQTYRPTDFNVIAGASVRMVMDVGNWDASRVINTPGQSGDPMSPHYRDLFPLWAAGTYVPMLYSRAAVEQGAETVMTLSPVSKP
jgi:penicillin amidase